MEEEVSSFYGTYLWPGNVETGVTIQTNCSYSCGTLTGGVATRYCGERGAWNPTNFDECPTRVTCDLVDIADVSDFKLVSAPQKEVGCFNHGVVTLVAYKLERWWL